MSHHVHRHTSWSTPDAVVVQVECARIDSETWDTLAAVVEVVAENGDPLGCLELACMTAGNLAAGQYPGQQALSL